MQFGISEKLFYKQYIGQEFESKGGFYYCKLDRSIWLTKKEAINRVVSYFSRLPFLSLDPETNSIVVNSIFEKVSIANSIFYKAISPPPNIILKQIPWAANLCEYITYQHLSANFFKMNFKGRCIYTAEGRKIKPSYIPWIHKHIQDTLQSHGIFQGTLFKLDTNEKLLKDPLKWNISIKLLRGIRDKNRRLFHLTTPNSFGYFKTSNFIHRTTKMLWDNNMLMALLISGTLRGTHMKHLENISDDSLRWLMEKKIIHDNTPGTCPTCKLLTPPPHTHRPPH